MKTGSPLLSASAFFSTLMLASSIAHAQTQNALDFDGIDDAVIVPGASSLIGGASGITLACWVYPTNAAPAYPDFDGFTGFRNEVDCDFYMVQIAPANTIEARFRNSALQVYTVTSPALVLNTWQHLALVYDGSQLILYHNGANVGSVAASGSITNGAVDLLIGDVLYSATHFYLDGRMDELALWNRALEPDEVSCVHLQGADALDPGLMLYYGFDQGTAGGNNTTITSLIDTQGIDDGMLSGFALNGSSSNFVDGAVTSPTTTASICGGEVYVFGSQNLTAPGTYYETYPTPSGCDSIVTLVLSVYTVNTAVTQLNVNLFATATGAAYQWLDCNDGFAEIPGATAQQYTATANGSYAVEVTQGGCTDTSFCYAINTIGIGELPSVPAIVIHPVPAHDRLTIDLGSAMNDRTVIVMDPDGRRLLTADASDAQVDLSIEALDAGAYLLSLESPGERRLLRFVKE